MSIIYKRNAIFAWILFGLIIVTNLAVIVSYLLHPVTGTPSLSELLFPLVPVLFALVGMLIISRQPRNVIGLVMMLPGLSFAFVIDIFLAPYISGQVPPPTLPDTLFLLVLWFSNWNWLLLVLPVMFIMLLFPTGRPFSSRWNWVVYFGLGIVVLLIFLITFTAELAPNTDPIPWSVPNPIGFLKIDWINAITGPFLFLFPIWMYLHSVPPK